MSETKVKEFSLFTEPLLISIKEWFIFIYHLMIDILTDVHQSQQVSSERLRRTSNWELSPFSDLNLSATIEVDKVTMNSLLLCLLVVLLPCGK